MTIIMTPNAFEASAAKVPVGLLIMGYNCPMIFGISSRVAGIVILLVCQLWITFWTR
jgi:hypothetical protein